MIIYSTISLQEETSISRDLIYFQGNPYVLHLEQRPCIFLKFSKQHSGSDDE